MENGKGGDKLSRQGSYCGPCPDTNFGHPLSPLTYPTTQFYTPWKSNVPPRSTSADSKMRADIRTQAQNTPIHPSDMAVAVLLVPLLRGARAPSLSIAQICQPHHYALPCPSGLTLPTTSTFFLDDDNV